jgi:hypothetical protein
VRDHQLWWLAPTLPNGVYHLQLRLITFPDRDMSPPVLLEQVTVSGRSHVFELPAQMGQRSGARFGDFARLLGFDYGLTKDPAAAVTLTLYWQPEEASPIPYTVSAQLLDGSGTLRAQRDREPGDGTFPTTSWVAGEVLADSYRIELPAGLPPGSYTLIVKMYDPVTAATLSVTVEGRHEALPLPGDMLRLATVEVR